MYGKERKGETKENETKAREGKDRRIIIVKQGKARKGKLSETRRSADKYDVRKEVEKCGNDFDKIIVK